MGVKGYPTMLLHSAEGNTYKYKGNRTLEDLKQFAEGSYKDLESFPTPE